MGRGGRPYGNILYTFPPNVIEKEELEVLTKELISITEERLKVHNMSQFFFF